MPIGKKTTRSTIRYQSPDAGWSPCHVLGEKDGEGVDEGNAVADTVPHHDDSHSRDPVVSKGESQGDEDGHEGEILLAEPDGAGPDSEQGDSPRHQPEGSVAPAPEDGPQPGIHGPRGLEDGEGTPDYEDEEDDIPGSTETLGNGRQTGQGRQHRGVRGKVEAAGQYLEPSGGILHPFEGPGWNQVCENLSQDHHPGEDDQSVRDLESAFCHSGVLVLTLTSLL